MQRPTDRRFASAQELLPLEDILDGVLCLRGGDYRAVLEAQSVNFGLKSEAEQEAIMAGYRAFLNALSYPIQVVVRILPTDVEPYLTALRGRASDRGAEAIRRLALDHEAFVRRLARERTLLERRFYVVIPAGLEGTFERTGARLGQRRGIRWPWQGRPGSARQGLEAASGQLTFRCQEIAQGLGGFGVMARRLGSDELVELWSAFLGSEVGTGRSAVAAQPVVVGLSREEAKASA
ncbi:MAG: hypothetical protein Q8Q00_06880 [Dehalococcoidia bacterium]|nr:hypothetical protein [Dehalococcoidia bacterium]